MPTDEELLRRAVKNARCKGRSTTRWEAVMSAFSLGSTSAADLCRRFNLDPDEQVK